MQNSSMRSYRSWMRLISLSVIAAMVAGCSAARLAYSNGETLSYWRLNAYVDFNSEQRPRVKKEIAALFAWHRKTQLKNYVSFLSHAQTRVQGPVSEADLLADYEDAKQRLLRIAYHALPQLADLALSLTDGQIAHIEKKFASNNEEYRKDYLQGEIDERQEFRFRKLLKHVEYWFGNFNREQEKALRAASDRRPLNNELVLESRVQRQQALIALLKKIHAEKPSREVAMRLISDYIHSALDRFGNQEHKKFFEASRLETVRLMANIVNHARPEQKQHFMDATQQWIADFGALAL